jgi:hypothetical protein
MDHRWPLARVAAFGLVSLASLASLMSFGCKYDPHPVDGALHCGPNDECPDGYACVSSLCWSSSVTGPATLMGCDGTTSFPANAQVVRSCVLGVSCSPFAANLSISDCVTLNTQGSTPGKRCTLGAKTCGDFQKCVGFGFAAADLCASGAGGRCVGTQAINCASVGNGSFFDCGAAGGTCVVSGTGADALADCRVLASCAETDTIAHCNGNFSYVCDQGVGYGSSCGADAYCSSDGTCRLTGETCSGSRDTCNGRVNEFCSDDGQLYKYNCASVGLGCGAADSGSWCLAPACSFANYNAASCTESCSGSKLTFCYGGVPYTVDCRNFGFASCVDGQSSGNVASYATCTN